ncbi:hypothetical protein GR254_08060 [Mycobacterium tuberculosis]|nr:hypothetical protein [Mycobacterium tuberculosis]
MTFPPPPTPPPIPAHRRADAGYAGKAPPSPRSRAKLRPPSGRARWVVRMLTSLLMFPGRDEADERAMIAEFVVPIVTPASAAARKAGHPGPE